MYYIREPDEKEQKMGMTGPGITQKHKRKTISKITETWQDDITPLPVQ